MKRSSSLSAILIAVTFIWVGPAAGLEKKVTVDWQAYDQGMDLGREEDKPILLNFFANWCRYCAKMDRETFQEPGVAAYLNHNFIPVKINAEKSVDLAIKYSVRGLPMLIFLTSEGEGIAPLPGFVPPKQFLTVLKFIKTDSYKEMSFKDFLEEENKRDPDPENQPATN